MFAYLQYYKILLSVNIRNMRHKKQTSQATYKSLLCLYKKNILFYG